MKFAQLHNIASAISSNNETRIIEAVETAIAGEEKDWKLYGNLFLDFIRDGKARFSIFKQDGNVKVPFVAFSVLPGITCPGAGDCLNYCYSFKAWRWPANFFGQAQNTLLIRRDRRQLKDAMTHLLARRKFRKMVEQKGHVDLRLYVDGDIDSMSTLNFWMKDFLPSFPTLKAYGYSKSFELFTAYRGEWPSNYALNISSGSKYGRNMVEQVKVLPVTRGEFIAVKIDGKYSAAKGEWKKTEVKRKIRKAVDFKVFPCPGQCGSCTGAGHACGNKNLTVTIAVPIH